MKVIETCLTDPDKVDNGRIYGLARIDEIEDLSPGGYGAAPDDIEQITSSDRDVLRLLVDDGWCA